MYSRYFLLLKLILDAGYTIEEFSNTKTGVFIGSSNTDFTLLQHDFGKESDIYTMIGSTQSMISNRVSYYFNLKGFNLYKI
jgi:acyl transferase domain-containing protein